MEFVSWILANFCSVEEVKETASSIRLAAVITEAGALRYRATDASGKQIVVESSMTSWESSEPAHRSRPTG